MNVTANDIKKYHRLKNKFDLNAACRITGFTKKKLIHIIELEDES